MKTIILAILLTILFYWHCWPLNQGEIGVIVTQSIAIDLTYADRFPVVMKTQDRRLKRK